MESAKEPRKQEDKQKRIAISAGGAGGAVVVLAATLAVASFAAIKFWKGRNGKTKGPAADELDKGSVEADQLSAEKDSQPFEISGKTREDKPDHDAKPQGNPQEIENEEGNYEIMVVLDTSHHEEEEDCKALQEYEDKSCENVITQKDPQETDIAEDDEANMVVSEIPNVEDTVTDSDCLGHHVNPKETEKKEEEEVNMEVQKASPLEVDYVKEGDKTIVIVPKEPVDEVEYKHKDNEGDTEEEEEEEEEENGREDSLTSHITREMVSEEEEEAVTHLKVGYKEEKTILVPNKPHFEVEYKEDEDELTTMVVKTPHFQVEYKEEEAITEMQKTPLSEAEYPEGFIEKQDHEHGDDVKNDEEELADEIEVESPSGENSSIDEDDVPHMENALEENKGDTIEVREVESTMDTELNHFSNESKLEVIEKEPVVSHEEQESIEGDSIVEKEDKYECYKPNLRELDDSGKSLYNSWKRHVKELLLDLSKRRIWIWAILVFVSATAAPMILSPGGVIKLFLALVLVVILSQVLQTIILQRG